MPKDTPTQPTAATHPAEVASGGLTEDLKAKIIQADIANIVKKVKAGKPLSDSERAIIANYPTPTTVTVPAKDNPAKKGWGPSSPLHVVEERVAEACAVIAQKPSIHRSELHALFRSRWFSKDGKPADWRTIDRMVSRARGRLSERSKRPKDAWIDDILNGYDQDISDKDPRVRLASRQGIRDMLGLDAIRKVMVGGVTENGSEILGPLVIRITGEEMPKPKPESNGHVVDAELVRLLQP